MLLRYLLVNPRSFLEGAQHSLMLEVAQNTCYIDLGLKGRQFWCSLLCI